MDDKDAIRKDCQTLKSLVWRLPKEDMWHANQLISKLETALPVWEHYQFYCNRRGSRKQKRTWNLLEREYRRYVRVLHREVQHSITWAALVG